MNIVQKKCEKQSESEEKNQSSCSSLSLFALTLIFCIQVSNRFTIDYQHLIDFITENQPSSTFQDS
jgi:hypothetical protein